MLIQIYDDLEVKKGFNQEINKNKRSVQTECVQLILLLEPTMNRIFTHRLNCRSNPIIMRHGKKLNNYSFLEVDIKNIIDSNMDSFIPQEKAFRFKLVKNVSSISNFCGSDFPEWWLLPNKSSNKFIPVGLERDQQIVFDLSGDFVSLKERLFLELQKSNLSKFIRVASAFNNLDIEFWQKAFSIMSYYQEDFDLKERVFWQEILKGYTFKFQPSLGGQYDYPYKFFYPEAYLRDMNLQFFLKKLAPPHDFFHEKDGEITVEIKKNYFLSRINSIQKIGKKQDLRIQDYQKEWQIHALQLMNLIKGKYRITLKQFEILSLYQYHFYINLQDQQFIKCCEQELEKNLALLQAKAKKGTVDPEEQFNEFKNINKLLSAWKLRGKGNEKMYYKFIQPFLFGIVDKRIQIQFYSSTGVNVCSSGIFDMELVKRIFQVINSENCKSKPFAHQLAHIHNSHAGSYDHRIQTAFCTNNQHHSVLKFLSKHNRPIYSPCLQYNERQTHYKPKEFEYHSFEYWWVSAIQNCISDTYQTIINAPFCVFEIDFLIITENDLIAVEFLGTHYLKDKSNNEITVTGKKQIRKKILSSYGIKRLEILSNSTQTAYYRSQSQKIAFEYIQKLIRDKFQIQIEGKESVQTQKNT